MSAPDWATYEDRMHRVIAYIHDHLDEELDLNKVAEVACLSPYHWHRVYKALMRETITQTVKRLRLQRAAHTLIHTSETVESVAQQNGFPNRESFSRAFHKAYGMAPSDYRENGGHTLYHPNNLEWSEKMYDVSVKSCDPVSLIFVPHQGSYLEIGKAFEIMSGAAAAQGFFNDGPKKMIGVYYDDPDSMATELLKSAAGFAVEGDPQVSEPLQKTTLSGGNHAILVHKGPYSELKSAYQFIYSSWLSQTGHVPGDAPCYEVYLNSPMDTAPAELLTEIHVPLQY